MKHDDAEDKFAYLLQPPKSLKLEFSKAADYERVSAAFDPILLSQVDPTGYVAKRLETDFRHAVDGGNAIFLADENRNVRSIAMGYQMHENDNAPEGTQHDYTEVGSALSYIPGYNSAFLLATTVAMKEWWCHPPEKYIVTEVKHDNVAPTKIYQQLGWVPLLDEKEVNDLFYLCYKNVADNNGDPVDGPPMAEKSNIGFYKQIESSLEKEAQTIITFMDQDGLKSKSGDCISIDFSALDQIGLTRPRLEAMANGETSRDELMKIGAPSTTAPTPPSP